jgi:hypothetical protein
MTPDPDHVQVLAAQLHTVECLPGSMPYARYSDRHRGVHERRARLVLSGLSDAGYTLTATKES